MKKWFNSPRYLFGILRVVSVLAIIVGVWLCINESLPNAFFRAEGLMGDLRVAAAVVNCALWVIAWSSFMGMCRRLMRGDTAFTAANSRTLKGIGICVVLIGSVTCLRALPELVAQADVYWFIETIVLPGTFLTVGVLAFILSRLLDHAMALEAEQADVV